MSSTNFDDFSSNYKQLLDRSVAVAGESGDYFAEYKASYLARVAGHDFSGKILDYGCGVGLLSGVLKKHLPHASIHGYDVSDGSIRRVAPHLAAQGVFSSDLSCLHSDYELAVISNVMHHVPSKDRKRRSSRSRGGSLPAAA